MRSVGSTRNHYCYLLLLVTSANRYKILTRRALQALVGMRAEAARVNATAQVQAALQQLKAAYSSLRPSSSRPHTFVCTCYGAGESHSLDALSTAAIHHCDLPLLFTTAQVQASFDAHETSLPHAYQYLYVCTTICTFVPLFVRLY